MELIGGEWDEAVKVDGFSDADSRFQAFFALIFLGMLGRENIHRDHPQSHMMSTQ